MNILGEKSNTAGTVEEFAKSLSLVKLRKLAAKGKGGQVTEAIQEGILARLPMNHVARPFAITYAEVGKRITKIIRQLERDGKHLHATFVSFMNVEFVLLFAQAFSGENATVWRPLFKDKTHKADGLRAFQGVAIHICSDLALGVLQAAQTMEEQENINVFTDPSYKETYQDMVANILKVMPIVQKMFPTPSISRSGMDILINQIALATFIIKTARDMAWEGARASFKPGQKIQKISTKSNSILRKATTRTLAFLDGLGTADDVSAMLTNFAEKISRSA